MRLRKVVKSNALQALRRHWSRAAAIALILLILSQLLISFELLLSTLFDISNFVDPFGTPRFYLDDLPNATPAAVVLVAASMLLRLVLLVPLHLGTKRWFYRAGDGLPEETFAIFEYFSSLKLFCRSIWLSVQVALRGLFWAAVFLFFPCALILFAQKGLGQGGTDFQNLLSTGLEVAGILLLILMSFFLLLRLMGYYLVPFALAEYPEESAGSVIRISVQASRGHRWALLLFELSMIGWRILELLIVPGIFTYPYRTTAQGLYAHYLFERMRREEAQRQNGPVDASAPEPAEQAAPAEGDA